MPIRFRKSFKIFPGVKVHVSKGGVSLSVGGPGATLNFSRRGVRQTIGIPGSGVSASSYLFKKDSKSDMEKDKDKDNESDNDRKKESDRADHEEEEEQAGGEVGCFPVGCLMLLALGAVLAYYFGFIPRNFMSEFMLQVTQWLRSVGL